MKNWLWEITVRAVNPFELKEKDFLRLNEVTQDMWANWIWEFVQCKCCSKMMSKKDIFWHLEQPIYDKTTTEIIKILDLKEIPCINCQWETSFVYWEENLSNIKERLIERESHIVVCEKWWEIIWYMDWYTDNLQGILNREYYSHYNSISFDEISNRVATILWDVPDKLLVFSWIWLIERESNFFNIYSILRAFFNTISNIDIKIPAISEVDKNNNMDKIFSTMWYFSLWINSSKELASKVTNIWNWYQSDLVIFPNPIERFRRDYSMWVKSFLRKYSNQKEIVFN